jgi:hypothetical protein
MNKIPDYFKPILWSYDFSLCDPIKMKNTIIANAISYGNFEHWRWIKSFYGTEDVRKVLNNTSNLTIRPSVLRLADLMF